MTQENILREVRVGDTIKVKSRSYEVGEILSQDCHKDTDSVRYGIEDKSYIDLEFNDVKGKYHHWKSQLDGGYVLYKNSLNIIEYSDLIDPRWWYSSITKKNLVSKLKLLGYSSFEDARGKEILRKEKLAYCSINRYNNLSEKELNDILSILKQGYTLCIGHSTVKPYVVKYESVFRSDKATLCTLNLLSKSTSYRASLKGAELICSANGCISNSLYDMVAVIIDRLLQLRVESAIPEVYVYFGLQLSDEQYKLVSFYGY